MASYVEDLIQKYAAKGILVDTNILLVLFFGALDRKRIPERRGTEQFTESDYDLLNLFLGKFRKIITTPHIMTEVSSFINNLTGIDRTNCYKILATALDETEGSPLLEIYLPSKHIASSNWALAKYGLTDCGIAEIAHNEYLVLTNDFKVASYLHKKGVDTISFVNLKYGQ